MLKEEKIAKSMAQGLDPNEMARYVLAHHKSMSTT
jgi:hypothetical protein